MKGFIHQKLESVESSGDSKVAYTIGLMNAAAIPYGDSFLVVGGEDFGRQLQNDTDNLEGPPTWQELSAAAKATATGIFNVKRFSNNCPNSDTDDACCEGPS